MHCRATLPFHFNSYSLPPMTRLQSTKRIRLAVILIFIVVSFGYIVTRQPPTTTEDALNVVQEYLNRKMAPISIKGESNNKQKESKNGALNNKLKGNSIRPPLKQQGTPPQAIPHTEDEDPINNPHGFLGDINEIDDDEEELFSGMYDSAESDEKGVNRPGVPKKGSANPSKPIVTDEKDFADVPQDFASIDITPMTFRIYSHNVRNGGRDILDPGEESWLKRYRKITASIKFNSQLNTVVALQEVYKFQLDDIMRDLNRYSPPEEPEWEAYGVGRIDGDQVGEFVPILFKTSEWEMVFYDSIWLNEDNPRMALEGWDAKYLRIVSYVTLKHVSGNYINVFNTHLDHMGELSKQGLAQIILDKMNSINQWPSFLCGDLNTEPNEKAYQIITEQFRNLAKLTTAFNKYGHSKSTVTGFEGEVLLNGGQNIDYIFAPSYTAKLGETVLCDKLTTSPPPERYLDLRLKSFGMLHSKFNGLYMSDHRPIVADFTLKNKCKGK